MTNHSNSNRIGYKQTNKSKVWFSRDIKHLEFNDSINELLEEKRDDKSFLHEGKFIFHHKGSLPWTWVHPNPDFLSSCKLDSISHPTEMLNLLLPLTPQDNLEKGDNITKLLVWNWTAGSNVFISLIDSSICHTNGSLCCCQLHHFLTFYLVEKNRITPTSCICWFMIQSMWEQQL